MSEIRPFLLHSFEEEAREDLARAHEEARAAIAERDRLREELARVRGDVARVERERAAAEVAAAGELLKKAADELRARHDELVAAAERELVRLSVAIAEKIVKREVAIADDVAVANVRRAIELSVGRRELRIAVHPEDLSRIEAFLPDLRREFTDLGGVVIEASDAVARGGCVVSTREGSVDATIAAQLEEIERGLVG